MNKVQELLDVTEQFHSHLEKGMTDDRDVYIQSIDTFLEKRQALIDALPKTYTEADKQVGKEIVALNEKVDNLLENQLLLLKNDLDMFKKNKVRQQHYANPYKGLSVDGMYFDKKK